MQTGALEIIKVIVGVVDPVTADDHAMVGEKEDVSTARLTGHTLPFGSAER